MSAAAAIRVSDLTIAFPPATKVLERVSLSIEAGEIVAMVGASGCGKSTLLRAIAGMLTPQSGQVNFEPALGGRPGELAFVFQSATLLPWRSVDENIALPLELGQRRAPQQSLEPIGLDQPANIATVRRAVGLDDAAATKFPRQLSGGMQMRTSIARALVTDPSVLLLDEPFAALDDILRSKLNDLLLQLWDSRPRTIVFVTHNIAEAIYLSHRIVILGNNGIASILDNQLPWPRRAAIRSSLEFAALYGQVSATLSKVSG